MENRHHTNPAAHAVKRSEERAGRIALAAVSATAVALWAYLAISLGSGLQVPGII